MKIAVDIDEVLIDQDINREYYDRRAIRWASKKTDSFWHEESFIKFRKYFTKGDKILDLGCAYGIHVPLFLGLGRDLEYEGMDISSSMLKIARCRYPQLKFILANILDKKTIPKGEYDGFWSAAMMMHISKKDWPDMLANIQKMMMSGAIGYITLPSRRPNVRLDEDKRIFSFWTPIMAQNFLKKFGWQVLAHGKCLEYNNSGWWWMIVKLPKK